MIVHASCNFLTVNTRTKDHPISDFQDTTMMKNKSKKQDDEGSAQSNASRYDPNTFLPFPYQVWLFTFSSMVDHLCIHLRRGFDEVHQCHEWPCYCLIATPWFSYHFLTLYWGFRPVLRDHCLQDVCVRPQENSFALYYVSNDLSHMFYVLSL